jgi:malate dehydrogenase (oxaloacetate-decarboxylating)(NADP+)
VILGGFINGARLSAAASGRDLKDQRIVFMGAGSAGVGVAKQLLAFFKNLGMSEEEAKARVWLVDTKVRLLRLEHRSIRGGG